MEKLFKEWRLLVRQDSDHFVEDGIICKEKWLKSNKKILFILKETNDYKGSISELIKIAVISRPKSGLWQRPTFHNIGRWAYGLLHIMDKEVKYKDADKFRKEALLSCAFMNIKKTTGGSTATKSVDEHAKKYSNFIRREIELIEPDIIIFGGTYDIMKKYVFLEMENVSPRVYKYKEYICIDANHPAYFKMKREDMYAQVVSSYRNYAMSMNLTKIDYH